MIAAGIGDHKMSMHTTREKALDALWEALSIAAGPLGDIPMAAQLKADEIEKAIDDIIAEALQDKT
jgi:hypothetical protein